jgi:hypothetical protein
MNKGLIFSAVLVCFLVFGLVFVSCGGGNNLSGTWEENVDRTYPATISFSGKNFTLTEYYMLLIGVDEDGRRQEGWYTDNSLYPDRHRTLEKDQLTLHKNEGSYQQSYIGVLKGKYSVSKDKDKLELLFEDGKINVLSFSRTENTLTIDRKQFTRKK